MRATVFVALLGAIAMLLVLTAVAWKRSDWGLVLFGIALILFCASAIPDLLKKEAPEVDDEQQADGAPQNERDESNEDRLS
jgi:ABC-type Fe3+-siderophore transport system permease subunit